MVTHEEIEQIKRETIEECKNIFVQKEYCHRTTEDMSESIMKAVRDIPGIKTLLWVIVGILGAIGASIVGALIHLWIGA